MKNNKNQEIRQQRTNSKNKSGNNKQSGNKNAPLKAIQ